MPAIAFARAKRSPSGTPAIPPPMLSCAEKRLAFSKNAYSCVHVISSGTESSATPTAAASSASSPISSDRLNTTAAAPARPASRSIRDACPVPDCTPTARTTAPGAWVSGSVQS